MTSDGNSKNWTNWAIQANTIWNRRKEVYLSAAYWVYDMSPGLGGLTIKPICDMDGYCQLECLLDENIMHNNYLPTIHI